MTGRPNVILLTIDALRADHVGYHGYERDTTPFLDSLASKSLTFENAISPSSHTREALPALLSGQYPDLFAENGYRCVTETIASRLSSAGYRTAGFHSNPYVSRAYGFDDGFDTFDDDLLLGKHRLVALAQRALDKFVFKKGQYHVRASELNDRSLDWLDSLAGEQPFFLWNHYMDPHGPYNPPRGHLFGGREISDDRAHDLYQKVIKRPSDVTDSEKRELIDCYDGEIQYLDKELEQFFSEMESRGLRNDSLILITADHGEAFGEDGYFTHPRQLHDYLLHVPLLLSLPNEMPTATVTSPVSTLDVAPTVLETANVPQDELPGTALSTADVSRETNDDAIVFSSATGEDQHEHVRQFAARVGRLRALIERDIGSGEILNEQVWETHSSGETQASSERSEAEGDELLSKLRTHSAERLDSVSDLSGDLDSAGESAEIHDRLKALGYE